MHLSTERTEVPASQRQLTWRIGLALILGMAAAITSTSSFAQVPRQPILVGNLDLADDTQPDVPPSATDAGPVERVASLPKTRLKRPAPSLSDVHPLDDHMLDAQANLANIRRQIRDYSCVLFRQERIGGNLQPQEFISLKIRNRRLVDGELVVPFSIYMKFLKPSGIRGREVVYVEGQNNGKMLAHEGGMKRHFLPSVWLPPDGKIVMSKNRYPLTEVGIENLAFRILDRGTAGRNAGGTCDVKTTPNSKVNGRVCTCVEVTVSSDNQEFGAHRLQVFTDDELQIPIRYVAYDWPAEDGCDGEILEQYTYLKLKTNLGLDDTDFDPKNPKYGF